MPYKLVKQGSKYCVVKSDTGENKGCSDSKEMGLRHMRALYANSGDSKELGCQCDVCLCLDQYDQLEEIKEVGDSISQGVAEAIGQLLDGVKSWMSKDEAPRLELVTLKQADNRTRVMMRASNNFKDRHKEIITEAAHKEYVDYVEKEKDYPEFWLWHTKGSRWGQADLVSYDDGFLTVSGLADQGMEYVAEGLAKLDKDLGVSHGFVGWGEEGLIHWYRMKECSPLPRQEAANILTDFLRLEKGMDEKRRKFFSAVGVPDAVLDSWDKQNKDIGEAAKQAGFEFKDLVEEPPAPEPPPKPDDDEKLEVTLPDGSKALVAKSLVAQIPSGTSQSTGEEMPTWAKDLMGKIEQIEKKSIGNLDQWDAAVRNGMGYSGSKEGESPTGGEQNDQKEWEKQLAGFLTGGTN